MPRTGSWPCVAGAIRPRRVDAARPIAARLFGARLGMVISKHRRGQPCPAACSGAGRALARVRGRWYYRAVATMTCNDRRSNVLARGFLVALALAVSMASAAPAFAQWSDVERWLSGSPPISLGVDTSRFRIAILGAKPVIATDEPSQDNAPYRLIDPELRGTAVSLDLKLRWPSWGGAFGTSSLEPYLSFGPTLYLSDSESQRVGLSSSRADNSVSLGVNVGAGLSWRL